jgi:hypothetical protein
MLELTAQEVCVLLRALHRHMEAKEGGEERDIDEAHMTKGLIDKVMALPPK